MIFNGTIGDFEYVLSAYLFQFCSVMISLSILCHSYVRKQLGYCVIRNIKVDQAIVVLLLVDFFCIFCYALYFLDVFGHFISKKVTKLIIRSFVLAFSVPMGSLPWECRATLNDLLLLLTQVETITR